MVRIRSFKTYSMPIKETVNSRLLESKLRIKRVKIDNKVINIVDKIFSNAIYKIHLNFLSFVTCFHCCNYGNESHIFLLEDKTYALFCLTWPQLLLTMCEFDVEEND